ncbi:MAG TPA: hypothetical protein PKC14_04850, partial [Candidatus Absconditabacterales bacterium]|nr:hypothetical protein [Candidatus Absconditabacterales bacterium]
MKKNWKNFLGIILGFILVGGGYVFFVQPYILSDKPVSSETKNQLTPQLLADEQINSVTLGFGDQAQEAPAGIPQLSYVNGTLGYQYSECNRAPEALYCNGNKEIIASDRLFQKYGSQLKDQNFQLHKLTLNQQDYPEKIIFQQKDFKGEIRAGKYQNSGDQIVFDTPNDEQGIVIRLGKDIWLKNAGMMASGSLLWIPKNFISVSPRYYQVIFSHQESGVQQDFSRASIQNPAAQTIDFSNSEAHSDQNVVQKRIDQEGQTSFSYGSNRATTIFGRETKVSNTHNLNLIGPSGVISFVGYARSSATPKVSINDFLGNQLAPNFYKVSFSGNNLLISFKNLPPKGKFVIKLQDKTQDFMVKFGTFSPFVQTLEKNITKIDKLVGDYSDGNYRQVKKTVSVNNFHLCFNQPLDQKSVRNSFAQSFSSGAYSLVFSQTNEDYSDSENNDFCLMFYYYLDPEKNHTFELKNIQSIFGEKLSTKISIPKHDLPDEHFFATVAGNTVNVLPKNGYLGDKIQIAYKNIKQIDIDYRTCSLLQDPKKIEANLRKNTIGSQRDILFSFMNCEPQKSQQITFPNFQRRSNKVLDYPVNKIFGNKVPSLFRVGVDSSLEKSQGKFFQRTNIGLMGKYAQGKLFVWSHDLVNGKPFKDIILVLNYFDPVSKKWISISQTGAQGASIFSVPVTDQFIDGFLLAKTVDDEAFMMLQDLYFEYNPDASLENYQQGASYNNSFAIDSWQIGAGRSWESPYGLRLYAYTDRALYKPGDDVFVSGWLRR